PLFPYTTLFRSPWRPGYPAVLTGLPALQLDLGLGIAETDRPVDPDRRPGLVRDDDLRPRGHFPLGIPAGLVHQRPGQALVAMLWMGIHVLEPDDPAAVAKHAKPGDHAPGLEGAEPRAKATPLHLAHCQQPAPVEPFPSLRLAIGMHGFLQIQGSLPVSVALQGTELGDLIRARRRRGHGGGEHRTAVGLQARPRQFCLVPRVATGAVDADSHMLGAGELAGERVCPGGDRSWRGRSVKQQEVPPIERGIGGGAGDLVAGALLNYAAPQTPQHHNRAVTPPHTG